MKQALLVVGIGCLLCAAGGCGDADRGIPVVVDVEGQFPEFLVGTWKADERGWEFVFERDGTISSAVIDGGAIKVKPSKRVWVLQTEAGSSVYELGPWRVQYRADGRELAVEINVEHAYIDMVSFAMEAQFNDWFIGPVSPDSQIWQADWYSFPKYTVVSPETVEFPPDPNATLVARLSFRKQ